MIIFPAIDLKDGQCVRLVQGRVEEKTVYSDTPAQVACDFEEQGAQWLHVVDLDGAFSGKPQNTAVIKQIATSIQIPFQVGGGLRRLEDVETILNAGARRVIIGSKAVSSPQFVKNLIDNFGPEHIILGLDARDGMVTIEGWVQTSSLAAVDFGQQMKSLGVKTAVFTDVSRDGLLQGPNLASIENMARNTGLQIIASGGVTSKEDLRNLKAMEKLGVCGAIIGKAIYDGRITLAQALEVTGDGSCEVTGDGSCEVTQEPSPVTFSILKLGVDVMSAIRIIPCLDVHEGRVVKGINFENLRDAGDPVELAAYYEREGADELVFLDISASVQGRKTMVKVARKTAQAVTIPFIVGGGMSTIDDISSVLEAGADKISINSAAVNKPSLITEAAEKFGSQRLIVAIDAIKKGPDNWEVVINGGQKATGLDAIAWAKEVERLGAGEILVTSMDRDGTKDGYDIELTAAISEAVGIPVIASGGAGKLEHLYDAVRDGKADAVLCASIFHFREYTIKQAKEYLAGKGVAVRL